MSSTAWATRATSASSTSPGPRRRPDSAGRRNTASRPDPMTDKNTPAVAFIRLGSRGLGMAKNLLKHGQKVVGVDPSAAARDAFKAAGGTIADTPAAAVKSADVMVIAVVNDKQVDTVLFGEDGAAE